TRGGADGESLGCTRRLQTSDSNRRETTGNVRSRRWGLALCEASHLGDLRRNQELSARPPDWPVTRARARRLVRTEPSTPLGGRRPPQRGSTVLRITRERDRSRIQGV